MIVSVCIIALNEEKALPLLLEEIVKQDYAHGSMEVVLVDSKSEDRTRDIMNDFAERNSDFADVVVAVNAKRIQAAGWNVAIKSSTGDVIIRIDAHASIPSDFVRQCMLAIEGGEMVVGGARPNIAVVDTPWQQVLLQAESAALGSGIALYRKPISQKQYVKSIFHGTYRREVFEKVGGFDERFGRTEDNELHYRIRKAGYQIAMLPEIISYQHIRATWKNMIKQKYANGYWVALTLGICPGCLSLYHFAPLTLICCLLILVGVSIATQSILLFGCSFLIYMIFNICVTVFAVAGKEKHWQQICLPLLFMSIHISYGIGSFIGLVKMPFWCRRIKKEK